MTQTTYQFILALLSDSYDGLIASRLFLKHQLSLPQNHRIQADDEDLMMGEVKRLNIEIKKHETAIAEFTKYGKIV